MRRPQPTEIKLHAIERFRERHGQVNGATGPFWFFNPITRNYSNLEEFSHRDVAKVISCMVSRSVDLTMRQRGIFRKLYDAKRRRLSADDNFLRFDDLIFVVKGENVVKTVLRVSPDLVEIAGLTWDSFAVLIGGDVFREILSGSLLGEDIHTRADVEDAFRRTIESEERIQVSQEKGYDAFGQIAASPGARTYIGTYNSIGKDRGTVPLLIMFVARAIPSGEGRPERVVISRYIIWEDDVDAPEEEPNQEPPKVVAATSKPKRFTLNGYQANVMLSSTIMGVNVRQLSLEYARFASGVPSLERNSSAVQGWKLDFMRAMTEARIIRPYALEQMLRAKPKSRVVGIAIPATARMEVGWKSLLCTGVLKKDIVHLTTYMQSAKTIEEMEAANQLQPKPEET